MEENKTDMQKAVENKFQQLMDRTESDPQLKKEVMSTITRIENLATLVDLFTIKLVKTETSLLNGISGDLETYSESDPET